MARLDSLQDAAHQARSLLATRPTSAPSLASLLQELRQLTEEFADVTIDFKQRHVSVTTEPIELEGVYLGSFAIQLRWNELPRGSWRSSLAVVALEPHPAATDDGITHPHVKDEVLCAGDATVPLERALREGRLADACLLVRGVLTHYNDNSPHVPLKEWYGGTCAECGAGLNTDCTNYCEGCNSDCCDDCYRFCEDCEIGRIGPFTLRSQALAAERDWLEQHGLRLQKGGFAWLISSSRRRAATAGSRMLQPSSASSSAMLWSRT